GRFTVRLPFKANTTPSFDNTYNLAKRRFIAVENRLQKNLLLKNQYIDFMEEYLSLGHMEKAPMKYNDSSNEYFLPHHSVVKDSNTTKLRVVFDASAKDINGTS
ncbi:MAG TPA: hypothetical protein DDZ41_03180, partial [Flavobacterium sp.]|nr:hypothetical protein [Flavobacterium sp.]